MLLVPSLMIDRETVSSLPLGERGQGVRGSAPAGAGEFSGHDRRGAEILARRRRAGGGKVSLHASAQNPLTSCPLSPIRREGFLAEIALAPFRRIFIIAAVLFSQITLIANCRAGLS
jgi:hypothetical protein